MINNMAREAGLPMSWLDSGKASAWPELERFAQLVVAAERENCIERCRAVASATTSKEVGQVWGVAAMACAAAIRNQEKK